MFATTRGRPRGAVVLLVVGLTLAPLAVGTVPENGIVVDRLEADLHTRLPDGSSWEQAEAWFASHGIEPRPVYGGTEDRAVGLRAAVPNDTLFEAAEIRITLYFSPNGRLIRRDIYRFVHSP
jgi:hypothetical protein